MKVVPEDETFLVCGDGDKDRASCREELDCVAQHKEKHRTFVA